MESLSASTTATVLVTTTGSFQNQPPTPSRASGSRKRGIACLLQDVTNLCEEPQSRTRRARVKASHAIQSLQPHLAPRGNPGEGARAKRRTTAAVVPVEAEPAAIEPMTLADVIHDKSIISRASENVVQYGM